MARGGNPASKAFPTVLSLLSGSLLRGLFRLHLVRLETSDKLYCNKTQMLARVFCASMQYHALSLYRIAAAFCSQSSGYQHFLFMFLLSVISTVCCAPVACWHTFALADHHTPHLFVMLHRLKQHITGIYHWMHCNHNTSCE